MALMFGNLFEKKECAICGAGLGVLGNTKLADGVICKACYEKLSPWSTVGKTTTVREVADQLAYREQNRADVDIFRITRTLGEGTRVLIDEEHKGVVITPASNLKEGNPDVLGYGQITGCDMEVKEAKREQTYRDEEQKKSVSYDPPRYEYNYDFYITVYVDHPFFSQIRFRVNRSSVHLEDVVTAQPVPHYLRPQSVKPKETVSKPDPESDETYRSCLTMTQTIYATLMNIRTYGSPDAPEGETPAWMEPLQAPAAEETPEEAPAEPESPAPETLTPLVEEPPVAAFCPQCGKPNTGKGKFCPFCGGSLQL